MSTVYHPDDFLPLDDILTWLTEGRSITLQRNNYGLLTITIDPSPTFSKTVHAFVELTEAEDHVIKQLDTAPTASDTTDIIYLPEPVADGWWAKFKKLFN